MPKINKEQLLSNFQELYATEQKARDYYGELLKMEILDTDRHIVNGILDDEEKHMKIVKSIIEIIKTGQAINSKKRTRS